MDEEYLKRLGLSIARGVPQMATGLVDLAALPFTLTGLLEPEQAVGSTDWMTKRGYLPPKQEGLLSETSELMSSAMSPAGAAKSGLLGLGMIAGAKGQKAITKAIKTAQDEAMEIAQKNAALPIEKGGLGLPANNTAIDRARAMGADIDNPIYRGTVTDEIVANPNMGTGQRQGTGIWASKDPYLANTYAENPGGNVMPLVMLKDGNVAYVDWKGQNWGDAPINASLRKEGAKRGENLEKNKDFNYSPTSNTAARIAREKGYSALELKNIADMGGRAKFMYDVPETADNVVVFKPEMLRSRFAAFDPMRRNEPDLLASILAGLGLGGLLSLEEEQQY